MAIYLTKTPDGKERLIDCRTAQSAINHVAREGITADPVKPTELYAYFEKGIKIEKIKDEADEKPAKAEPAATTAAPANVSGSIGAGAKEKDSIPAAAKTGTMGIRAKG